VGNGPKVIGFFFSLNGAFKLCGIDRFTTGTQAHIVLAPAVATVVIGRDAERDCVKPCAELVLVIIQSNLLPGSGQSFLSNVFCIRNISGQTAFQNRQQPRPISASKLFKRNRAAGSGALSQLV
jgi:hypothetical protein